MVHQFKNNGYNIVLDVCSGSVHVVDDLVYDIIELYQKKTKEDIISELAGKADMYTFDGSSGQSVEEQIAEAYDAVKSLSDSGQLFTEDEYKNLIIDFKKRQTVVKALCLNVSHDCNLACKYCFAGQGEYNGPKEIMSLEVGKRALDFLIENSGNRKNLEVDFFGGEPLMNFEVVKQLVEYGRKREKETGKNFRFTLTTNGILLNDEVLEFANKELVNVVLSIDGRKTVHDSMRPTRNGKSSFDIILPKYKKFKEGRKGQYYVRGTFTHFNTDFCKDVLALIDEGFDEVSMEPVVAPPTEDYAITEADVPIIEEQYDLLAKELLKRYEEGRPVNFFHFMIDLEGGPCVYKRLSGCGSGTEYLAVTPGGDLYPCHQFVGNSDFIIGNVYDGIKRTDIVDEFKLCNVYAKDKCRDCFARFYCSGGCAANAYQFHGSLLEAYDIGCKLEQKRIECALMMKAAMADIDAARGGSADISVKMKNAENCDSSSDCESGSNCPDPESYTYSMR
ncbi:MAG: thioether cross-link-forming SCIFF peptide maturase [Eubacterium sp.]|nr:thioether cross-link-forming SCIFF peptide maturase [Eubacterium sp.]